MVTPEYMQEERLTEEQEIQRVKIPKGRETIGMLEQRLGSSRNKVRCMDGKTRVCRIPGRLKRRLWVREGDIVLVAPWEYDNEKGDIIFKYRPSQIAWLKGKGYLKSLDSTEEF